MVLFSISPCNKAVKRPHTARIPLVTPDVLAEGTCHLKEVDDVTLNSYKTPVNLRHFRCHRNK